MSVPANRMQPWANSRQNLSQNLPISRLNLPNYKGALSIGDALAFVYTTNNPITVAASGNASDTIQIQADSAFLFEQSAALVFQGATFTTQTTCPLLIQITDSGSGAALFSAPIPLNNIAYLGGQGEPFVLSTPRLIAPSSLLTVAITNLDTANAYTVRFNLQGRKIYSYNQPMAGV